MSATDSSTRPTDTAREGTKITSTIVCGCACVEGEGQEVRAHAEGRGWHAAGLQGGCTAAHMHADTTAAAQHAQRAPHRDRRGEVGRHAELARPEFGADAVAVVEVEGLHVNLGVAHARVRAAQQLGLLARRTVVGEGGVARGLRRQLQQQAVGVLPPPAGRCAAACGRPASPHVLLACAMRAHAATRARSREADARALEHVGRERVIRGEPQPRRQRARRVLWELSLCAGNAQQRRPDA